MDTNPTKTRIGEVLADLYEINKLIYKTQKDLKEIGALYSEFGMFAKDYPTTRLWRQEQNHYNANPIAFDTQKLPTLAKPLEAFKLADTLREAMFRKKALEDEKEILGVYE
ncbi:hypothetical protein [Acidicapsa ligni]|uniref:hypothetical protein n=1 Tax=Acidicapsa ligni TaxID=542300 RepID=UPI0021DF6B8E|nr:hypothetical protein [Acidicapsa ligni]